MGWNIAAEISSRKIQTHESGTSGYTGQRTHIERWSYTTTKIRTVEQYWNDY